MVIVVKQEGGQVVCMNVASVCASVFRKAFSIFAVLEGRARNAGRYSTAATYYILQRCESSVPCSINRGVNNRSTTSTPIVER